MPIKLSENFMPGSNDPDHPEGYPFAQILNLYHSGITMAVTLEVQFGWATGDYLEEWKRGPGSPTKVYEISGPKVAALWGTMPNDGESVGEAVRRAVYEYLLRDGLIKGEIQNNPPLPPAQMEEAAAAQPADSEEALAPNDSAQEAVPESAEASPAADDAAKDALPSETPAPQEGATSNASGDSEQSS